MVDAAVSAMHGNGHRCGQHAQGHCPNGNTLVAANRGIFITTSSFTAEARAYVDRVQNRLVLIDGRRLAAEMVKRNVGVQVREVHEVKRIDEDFFTE